MKMRLSKLQDDNKEVKKLRSERLSKGWEDVKEVLYYQGLLYVPKVICVELISRYHDNLLAGHFDIKKTQKLMTRK